MSDRGRRRSATSSPPATFALAREALQHRKTQTWRSAFCQGPSCPLPARLRAYPIGLLAWREKVIKHKTAIFRQINKERVAAHHDALEFSDGQTVLLTFLCEGQQATVLQLPAEPKTVVETEAQQRAAYAG